MFPPDFDGFVLMPRCTECETLYGGMVRHEPEMHMTGPGPDLALPPRNLVQDLNEWITTMHLRKFVIIRLYIPRFIYVQLPREMFTTDDYIRYRGIPIFVKEEPGEFRTRTITREMNRAR